MRHITLQPLTRENFAPFGDAIEAEDGEYVSINNGNCQRFNDLAQIEIAGPEAQPLVSIFRAKPVKLPFELKMLERHPLGSQAFMPLSQISFLVIVARDNNGTPSIPVAFITRPGQGINLRRNTWHGVLTALEETSDFLVIDRGGEGNNLEEYFFDAPYMISMS